MSSLYTILCLSHDPAIAIDSGEDWRSAAPALEAVAARSGPAAAHPACLLLVGRYSYPLIEVCCPRTTASGPGHSGYHPHDDLWIDAGWLRLLAVATDEQIATARVRGCWAEQTARRLRAELNIGPELGAKTHAEEG